MEWPNDLSIKLIDEYHIRGALWDAENANYRNLPLRTKLWQEMANDFDCTVLEIRKKLGSLLASYRRERLKEIRVPPWKSKWFAFQNFSFLHPSRKYGNNSDPFTPEQDDNSDDDDSDSSETFKIPKVEEITLIPCTSKTMIAEKRKSKSPSPPLQSLPASLKIRKINDTPFSSMTAATKVLQNPLRIEQNYRDVGDPSRDPCTLFADYVVSKMKRYNNHTQNIVQHKINNILFEADMGNYDKSLTKNSNVESSFT